MFGDGKGIPLPTDYGDLRERPELLQWAQGQSFGRK